MADECCYDQNALLIQHDWNEVENGEKFFIGCRKYNHSSEYIKLTKLEGEIETGVENATVKKLSERKIEVKYAGFANQAFIAPSVKLDKLHDCAITSIDLSGDGNLIVSGDVNGNLKIWNARNGVIRQDLIGHIMNINRCRFTLNVTCVVSCGLDMTIRVWSVSDGQCKLLLKGHSRDVIDFAFVKNGKQLVSASKDCQCLLFDIDSEENLEKWKFDCEVNAIAADKDLEFFACGLLSGEVVCLSLTNKAKRFSLNIGNQPCTALFLSNEFIYCGNTKGEIYLINIENRKFASMLRTIYGQVTNLSNSSFGLIASFADGVLGIFENPLNSANLSIEFTGANVDPIYDFSYSESNGFIFSVCRDKIIRKYHFK